MNESGLRRLAPVLAPPMRREAKARDCGFEAALAKQMLDSLMGNPHTVFYKESRSGDYVYQRVRSQNADWWQEFDGDRKKLRAAIERQAACEPLNPRRKEDRWLAEETERARREGWFATFHGKPSPIGIEPVGPAPKLERARFGKPPIRVYLALPELEVERMKMRAAALHQTPNLWLNHVVVDKLDKLDAYEASITADTPF